MTNRVKHEWIRDGLTRRGYMQKDLAVAWGAQQASVSRFLAGEEMQDLPLSRGLTLAGMLDITCEELARGLGLYGKQMEPTIEDNRLPPMPEGTISMSIVKPGIVALMLHKNVTAGTGNAIIKHLSEDQVADRVIRG